MINTGSYKLFLVTYSYIAAAYSADKLTIAWAVQGSKTTSNEITSNSNTSENKKIWPIDFHKRFY